MIYGPSCKPFNKGGFLSVFLLLVLFLAPNLSMGEDEQGSMAEKKNRPLTSMGEFWNLSEEARKQPIPVSFTFTAYYFDAEWGLLWGEEDNQTPSYIPFLRGAPLPFKSGQRISIQGMMTNNGLIADPSSVRLLAPTKILAPIDIGKQGLDPRVLNGRLVLMDMLVEDQSEDDDSHIICSAACEGQPVNLRIHQEAGNIMPVVKGAFVRARGVFIRSSDATGKLATIEVWAPSPKDVTVLSWLESDSRFSQPSVSIESLRKGKAGDLIHVSGTVMTQEPGARVTLRDETGQVVLETGQSAQLKPGEIIHAFGYLDVDGINLTLKRAIYRKSITDKESAATTGARQLPLLRLVDLVRGLEVSDVVKHYPVRLFAPVTWSDPKADFFYIQDASGGIKVEISPKIALRPSVGSLVEVVGYTMRGEEFNQVKATELKSYTKIKAPAPISLNLDQALSGVGESSLVELVGFFRQLQQDDRWARMELTTPSGDFSVLIPKELEPGFLLNSILRVQGVCETILDAKHRVTGIRLWVASLSNLVTIEPMPEAPFSIPYAPISSLGRVNQSGQANGWVHTAGIVTYYAPGRFLILQSGSDNLRALCRTTEPLAIGSKIEVVGLPGREQSRFVMRDVFWRSDKTEASIDAPTLSIVQGFDPLMDGRLVQMSGELLDCSLGPKGLHLILRNEGSLFESDMEISKDAAKMQSRWNSGSKVLLTGIYMLEHDEYQHPRGFHLQLRSPADVDVISAAPWWTPRRILVVTGLTTLFSCLIAFWAFLLRKEIHRQTAIIRAQMEKETMLVTELERSARLESLGNLAGGIAHDFNNLLTVILCNISLARLESGVELAAGALLSEAERGANRARALTQQLLTFARGGNPVLRAQNLDTIVRQACLEALNNPRISCSLLFAPDLRQVQADKDQIHQALHNLVTNAMEAMPEGGTLRIEATNEELPEGDAHHLPSGSYVKLLINDSGCGIQPGDLGKIFDPYFSTKGKHRGLGLAMVRSIIRRHSGDLRVESQPGKGTSFSLWLPVAVPAPSQEPKSDVPVKIRPLNSTRILFMDDEAPLRLIAATLFKKLGCDYTLTAEGGQAFREFEKARAEGKPYNLVILDLVIPNGMGGKELMEQLRKIDPELRAIVSSGYSDDPVLADFKAYGFSGIVPKPFQISDLENAIRQLAT